MAKLSAAQIDRAVGAVLASSAGDAMGAPYEFGPPNPSAPCELDGGGGFGWAPGEWTDDTQMAVAVLSVLATGSTDTDEIGRAMVRWYDSHPADVGNQTRAVLRAASRRATSAAHEAEAFQKQNPDAAGNGALMRTGPVALAHLDDRDAVARLVASVASLTHPHPDSVDACVLWSLAIERAIMTATATDEFDWRAALLDGLEHLEADRRDIWRARIDDAHGRDPSDYAKNNGWVVAAFQAAFSAITSTPVPSPPAPCGHLADALRLASRSGGDTDTVAAIAGSLLGARWGGTAVPLSWRRVLHGRRTYDEPALRAGDLDAIARLAVNDGRPDPIGWPGVRTLVDHYAARYPSRPLVKDIEGAWFGNVHGLPEALDQGATAVVSLCRMGSADVPAGVEHFTVALIDTTAEDNSNLAFVLADTAQTIVELVDEGERVFVHCVAAENRTPAVAAAYLMARGVESQTALERAAAEFGRRPQAFLLHGLTAIAGVS
jgi:ADP-ribosyl-[dinitrogen reductase] hydrolase